MRNKENSSCISKLVIIYSYLLFNFFFLKTQTKCNKYSDFSIDRFIDFVTVSPKYDTSESYLSITVVEILKETADETLIAEESSPSDLSSYAITASETGCSFAIS